MATLPDDRRDRAAHITWADLFTADVVLEPITRMVAFARPRGN